VFTSSHHVLYRSNTNNSYGCKGRTIEEQVDTNILVQETSQESIACHLSLMRTAKLSQAPEPSTTTSPLGDKLSTCKVNDESYLSSLLALPLHGQHQTGKNHGNLPKNQLPLGCYGWNCGTFWWHCYYQFHNNKGSALAFPDLLKLPSASSTIMYATPVAGNGTESTPVESPKTSWRVQLTQEPRMLWIPP
jgi:hypothetical protein